GCGMAGGCGAGREGHREAAGVRGAEQLLGIGAGRAFRARLERVRPRERAAAERQRAFAVLEVAFPMGFRGLTHQCLPAGWCHTRSVPRVGSPRRNATAASCDPMPLATKAILRFAVSV